MDGILVIGIIVAIVAPIYPVLIKMNRNIGRLEGEIKYLNGRNK